MSHETRGVPDKLLRRSRVERRKYIPLAKCTSIPGDERPPESLSKDVAEEPLVRVQLEDNVTSKVETTSTNKPAQAYRQ